MRQPLLYFTMICGLFLTTGCGSDEPAAETTDKTTQSSSDSKAKKAKQPPAKGSDEELVKYIKDIPLPEAVAAAFLEATTTGNPDVVAKHITTAARRIQKMSPSLPASKTAVYKILATEYPKEYKKNQFGDPRGAHVLCTYHEGAGDPIDVICMMRREPDSWRVQGLMMKFKGLPEAYPFNFENPHEMKQVGEQLNKDMQALAQSNSQPPKKVAKVPENPIRK